jgi:hypothetical protein
LLIRELSISDAHNGKKGSRGGSPLGEFSYPLAGAALGF